MPKQTKPAIVLFLSVVSAVWLSSCSGLPTAKVMQAEFDLPPQTRKTLDESTRLILFSLDSTTVDPQSAGSKAGEIFHDYPVLGKIEVEEPKDRAELLHALYEGIAQARPKIDPNGHFVLTRYNCWSPRHGVRATHGRETVDLLICFQCQRIEVYGRNNSSLSVSNTAALAFNRILDKAQILRDKSQ